MERFLCAFLLLVLSALGKSAESEFYGAQGKEKGHVSYDETLRSKGKIKELSIGELAPIGIAIIVLIVLGIGAFNYFGGSMTELCQRGKKTEEGVEMRADSVVIANGNGHSAAGEEIQSATVDISEENG